VSSSRLIPLKGVPWQSYRDIRGAEVASIFQRVKPTYVDTHTGWARIVADYFYKFS